MKNYDIFLIIGIVQFLLVSELPIRSKTQLGEAVLLGLLLLPFQFYFFLNSKNETVEYRKRMIYTLFFGFICVLYSICMILALRGGLA